MKKIFDMLVLAILLSMYLSAETPKDTHADSLPDSVPIPETKLVWAEAYTKKSVLRPGETVKITLMNFQYNTKESMSNKPETIIVQSSAGLIMGGTTVALERDGKSAKAFLIKGAGDKIEIYYRAPLRGNFSEVKIDFFTSPLFPDFTYPHYKKTSKLPK